MWNILSFEIVHEKKGILLVWPLGGFFISFQLVLLDLVSLSYFCTLILQNKLLETLAILD